MCLFAFNEQRTKHQHIRSQTHTNNSKRNSKKYTVEFHKLKHPIVFLRFCCVHTLWINSTSMYTLSSKKRQEIYFIANVNVCIYIYIERERNIRLKHAAFYHQETYKYISMLTLFGNMELSRRFASTNSVWLDGSL